MMTDKRKAREEAARIRESLTGEYMRKASEDIYRKMTEDEDFVLCENLFIYVSTEREPDTEGIIRKALEMRKRVFVPRCMGAGVMEALEIEDFDEELFPGSFGIREPKEGKAAVPEEIQLAVLPCVAASPDGRRLGHGGGYYDRFLAKTACPKAVLCFSRLLTEDIPMDVYDVKADKVIADDQ